MSTVARGHVADRPFARTVYTIAAKRFSGALVLTQGGRSYTVSWHEGLVVGADSSSPADAMGRIALTAGLVTSTQLADAMRHAGAAMASDQAQLELLAEVARLSPQQVLMVKRRAFAYRAVRIFALPEASFVLDDASSLPRDPDLEPVSVHWLIYQGLRTHYSEERLEDELRAVSGASFQLAASAQEWLGAYGFGGSIKPLLDELAGRAATLDELATACSQLTRKAIMAAVYALLATDALSASRPAGAQAAPSRPAEASRSGAIPVARPAEVSRSGAIPVARPAEVSRSGAIPVARPAEASRSGAIPVARPAEVSRSGAIPVARPADTAQSAPVRAQRVTAQASVPPPPASPPAASGSRAVQVPAASGAARGDKRAADERTGEVQALIDAKIREIDADADHYQLLGVPRDASAATIRAAYFDLAKSLHPDRLRAVGITDRMAQAQRLFAQVNQAYAVLSNPAKRAEYQAVLEAGGAQVVKQRDAEAENAASRLIAAEQSFRRGEMAARRELWSEALAHFQRAVELNPDEAEHHALHAWALWCATEDKQTIANQVKQGFKRAFSLSPRNVAAYFYRGRIASLNNELELALDCFRKVIELNPNHQEANLQVRLLESRLSKGGDKKGILDRLKRR